MCNAFIEELRADGLKGGNECPTCGVKVSFHHRQNGVRPPSSSSSHHHHLSIRDEIMVLAEISKTCPKLYPQDKMEITCRQLVDRAGALLQSSKLPEKEWYCLLTSLFMIRIRISKLLVGLLIILLVPNLVGKLHVKNLLRISKVLIIK